MSTLFTIGYERMRRPVELRGRLTEAGVDMLIDVRELPQSRKPGFSKSKLATLLAESGIEYDHLRPLGNPKPSRDLWKSGRLAEGEIAFRAHLNNGSFPAVRDVAERIAAGWRICLLCLEHDVGVCHRRLVAEAIVGELPGLELVHL